MGIERDVESERERHVVIDMESYVGRDIGICRQEMEGGVARDIERDVDRTWKEM